MFWERQKMDFVYPQEFKDFLKKCGLKLIDDKKADDISLITYGLWKEIQKLKK